MMTSNVVCLINRSQYLPNLRDRNNVLSHFFITVHLFATLNNCFLNCSLLRFSLIKFDDDKNILIKRSFLFIKILFGVDFIFHYKYLVAEIHRIKFENDVPKNKMVLSYC